MTDKRQNFEPDDWTNSLVATTYKADENNTARLDLSNLYTWEIRLQNPLVQTGGMPQFATIYFDDPAVHPNSPYFTIAYGGDPSVLSWGSGSLILSSQGSAFPSHIATIWVKINSNAGVNALTVWGSRRK